VSLATDLLEQAVHLADRERGRPRQASLRRAVSTAYYSLFHLILDDASRYLVASSRLRPMVVRSFDHRALRSAADALVQISASAQAKSKLRPHFDLPIAADLLTVCAAFGALQDKRHDADYNIDAKFTRGATMGLVGEAVGAHAAWLRVRSTHNAHAFVLLAANLLKER
jgi:hypothetical protein